MSKLQTTQTPTLEQLWAEWLQDGDIDEDGESRNKFKEERTEFALPVFYPAKIPRVTYGSDSDTIQDQASSSHTDTHTHIHIHLVVPIIFILLVVRVGKHLSVGLAWFVSGD